jgi:hypothetical protein
MVVGKLGTNHADEVTFSPETHAHDTSPLTAGDGAMPQPMIDAVDPEDDDPAFLYQWIIPT